MEMRCQILDLHAIEIFRSVNGPGVTFIDGGPSLNPVISVTSDFVTIDGFTISGFTSGPGADGIVLSSGTDSCQLFNNRVGLSSDQNNDIGIRLDNSHNNTSICCRSASMPSISLRD